MSTSVERETAKIYAFPVKPRMSGNGGTTDSRPIAVKSESVPMMDFGSWYHGDAIREAGRPGDRQG